MAEVEVTPYQARLYNAVLHGYEGGKRKLAPALKRVWMSRRHWQARALDAEKRLRMLEVLCLVAEEAEATMVSTAAVNHLAAPDRFPAPDGWGGFESLVQESLAREYLAS